MNYGTYDYNEDEDTILFLLLPSFIVRVVMVECIPIPTAAPAATTVGAVVVRQEKDE